MEKITKLLKQTLADKYDTLISFVNKMLSKESRPDPKIQNIIDKHFWDML